MIWKCDGKNKVPIDPETGRYADEGDRGIWMDYETARREKLRCHSADGIGFVLNETPFCLVDLDHCIRDGEVSRFASDVLSGLRGVEEVSASRTGMHSVVQGEKPGPECARKEHGREIEIYDSKRFVAIADESIVDKPIPYRQEALTALYWRIWPQMSLTSDDTAERPDSVLTDAEVLEKGRTARDTGQAFRMLYDKGETGGYFSRSEAHFGLCKMLGFWTGGDEEQVERLFWKSALAGTVERSNPKSYLRRTLRNAIARLTKFYEPGVGDALKERVRAMAQEHLSWIEEQDWSNETDRAVYEEVTRHAGRWAYLTDDEALKFSVNQQAIADAVGVSQRMVSKSLQRIREAGLLIRISKGHTGKNSYYKLHRFPLSEATPYSRVEPLRSTVYPPLCKYTLERERDSPSTERHIHSRTEGGTPSAEPALHGSGNRDSEPEPLPEENPGPDALPENFRETDEDGWETVG